MVKTAIKQKPDGTQRAQTKPVPRPRPHRWLFFMGKKHRLLVWPWNVLQGHQGWRHWTKHTQTSY